jgi:hypothetical protein
LFNLKEDKNLIAVFFQFEVDEFFNLFGFKTGSFYIEFFFKMVLKGLLNSIDINDTIITIFDILELSTPM